MSYQIEICANSVQSAINAELGGADRVELCDNLWEGGTTPGMGTIQLAKKYVKIPMFVLIRPRGGDFVYTDLEFEVIKRDIILSKEAKADGIVSGVLNADGTIDIDRTAELVSLSHPLPFTFHRAFDLVPDPTESLEELIQLGVQRILTSGLKETAEQGISTLKKLIEQSQGRIVIMPGGGVNANNIHLFVECGCREFHFSAKKRVPGFANAAPRVPMNSSADIPEKDLLISDAVTIRHVKQQLNDLL